MFDNNHYWYSLFYHEYTGSTFYHKYYNSKGVSLGKLDLTQSEFIEDFSKMMKGIEQLEGIQNIINTDLIKKITFDKVTNSIKVKYLTRNKFN